MGDFWKFISTLICLIGFLVTGISLLAQGTSFIEAVVKAVLVLAALFILQRALGAVLVGLTGSEPEDTESRRDENATT